MGPESEPETNNIRKGKGNSCNPCVGLDSLLEENILNSRRLSEKALATISVLSHIKSTRASMAVYFVLVKISRCARSEEIGIETYTPKDLVEERGPKGCNNGEQQHSRGHTSRSQIEMLCLALDSTEAHGQAG